MEPVLRFDLSAIPTDAVVKRATLSLWVDSRSNTNSTPLQVYRLLRRWNEAEVTWNQYAAGQRWSQAGANLAGADYDAQVVAQTTLSAVATWVNLDVTGAVQTWAQHPEQNAGLILKALSSVGVQYYFISSEYVGVGLRPMLTVVYQWP